MWLFLVIFCFVPSLSLKYTRELMQEKYPGFGSDWIPLSVNKNGEYVIGYFKNTEHLKPKSLTPNQVSFTLYTREKIDGIKIEAEIKFYSSYFHKTKPTKFITHGWLAQGLDNSTLKTKDEFLKKYDANVFVMDWHEISENIFYGPVVAETKDVAECYSDFLNQLVHFGVNPHDIHMVGHSLGAHVSGFAARGVKMGKIGRITALDPAALGFDTASKIDRLSNTDAEFVDVIHTCGGFLGLMRPIGDVDFYPFGGSAPQPGCWPFLLLSEGCSHSMSWSYFIDNLVSPKLYSAKQCKSYEDFRNQRDSCKDATMLMGDSVTSSTRGLYYLTSMLNDTSLVNQPQDGFSRFSQFINQ